MTDVPNSDYENNIIAAGGVLAALEIANGAYPSVGSVNLDPQVVMLDGQATNQLTIKPSFMKSRYRLIVERVPDEE